jgi:hypothetical protein
MVFAFNCLLIYDISLNPQGGSMQRKQHESRRGRNGIVLNRRHFLGAMAATAGSVAVSNVISTPRALAASTATGQYTLKTPHFLITGTDGTITGLQFGAHGNGNYSQNLLSGDGLYLQLVANGGRSVGKGDGVTWSSTVNSLTLNNIPFPSKQTIAQTKWSNGYDIYYGSGAGQTFTAPDGIINRLGLGLTPAGGAFTAPLSVSILTGGHGGTVVWQGSLPPGQITGGYALTWIDVGSLALTAGATYFIQLTTTDPAWACLYQSSDLYSGGEYYGWGWLPQTDKDLFFSLEYTESKPAFLASWTINARGVNLTSSYTLTAQADRTVTSAGFEFNTPWVMSGYDISAAPFANYYSDAGNYLPIQQLKRRASAQLNAANQTWIHASGQAGYDLLFNWKDIVCNFAMTSNTMTYQLYQASDPGTTQAAGTSFSVPFNVKVSPQVGEVPDYYPVFKSSDALTNTYLSSFYWDRAFSFVGNTATDWKDWAGRILDWVDGPLRENERVDLESIQQDSNGYVWTWGNAPGWPFPADYDSRHFTSNAMYILGISHYYSWTGDKTFLNTMMPRARDAMNYYLNVIGGQSGIITIDVPNGAPVHTGEDGAIGSNYWDITAHGWKDAYCNLYFYAALQALAELEDASGQSGAAQTLLQQAATTRQVYNQTFWNAQDGRYVQSIDITGEVHDYGSTYVNLEAMAMGLPESDQAQAICQWLNTGATELTTNVLSVSGGGAAATCPAGGTLGQKFTVNAPIAQVAARITTNGGHQAYGMTLTLYTGGPGGTQIAQKTFPTWWDSGWAHLAFDTQPAGTYYLEVSNPVGSVVWTAVQTAHASVQPYMNGQPITNPPAMLIAAVSPYSQGPADIYSRWKFAPRATSRRNNFWYIWAWEGINTPFEGQLQDGGTSLYLAGFDVIARAKYISADDAFGRFQATLQRYSAPDRLTGGDPLYNGEHPQNEVSAGSVGVDNPFPENGMAPASFLYAFIGLQATPQGLKISPNLPSQMDWAEVDNVGYRGKNLNVKVTHDTITVTGDLSWQQTYHAGDERWILQG